MVVVTTGATATAKERNTKRAKALAAKKRQQLHYAGRATRVKRIKITEWV